MTFAQIPAGVAIFLDANVLVYHFTNDPKYGPVCTQLLKRVEQGELHGFTSTHVLADLAHRLMTLEAIEYPAQYLPSWAGKSAFGWDAV
jgi:predicted nucleic acid-binding protein